MRSPRDKYRQAKSNARKEKLAFELTFDEWLKWWQDRLGPDFMQLRGCQKRKFVMARIDRTRPFELGNLRLESSGEHVAKLWRDPEHRKRESVKRKKAWRNKKYRDFVCAAVSEELKKRWRNPSYRAAMILKQSAAAKRRWARERLKRQQGISP